MLARPRGQMDQAADSELAGFWTWAFCMGSSAVCAQGPSGRVLLTRPRGRLMKGEQGNSTGGFVP